jgi:hypothetical protein
MSRILAIAAPQLGSIQTRCASAVRRMLDLRD